METLGIFFGAVETIPLFGDTVDDHRFVQPFRLTQNALYRLLIVAVDRPQITEAQRRKEAFADRDTLDHGTQPVHTAIHRLSYQRNFAQYFFDV